MILVCSKCGRYFTAPTQPEDGLCARCRAAQTPAAQATDAQLPPTPSRPAQATDHRTSGAQSRDEAPSAQAAREGGSTPTHSGKASASQSRPAQATGPRTPGAQSRDEAPSAQAAPAREAVYARAIELERNWTLARARELCELYLQLGDYRDAPARLNAARKRAAQEYDRDVRLARKGDTSADVEAALNRLRELNGSGNSAEVIAKGEQRLEALRKREREAARLAGKRRARRWLIAACAAVAVVAVGAFAYVRFVLPGYVRDAGEALDEGRYEDAVALYQKAGAGEQATDATVAWGDQVLESGDFDAAAALYEQAGAPERAAEAAIAQGDQALEAGDYDAAVAFYEKAGASERIAEVAVIRGDLALEAGDFAGAIAFYEQAGADDSIAKANVAWGERLLSDGDYAGAIEKFSAAGDARALDDAYFAWSGHVAQTRDAASAIAILAGASDTPERAARMGELQLQRADEALSELRALDDVDNDRARALGEPLTSLDAQLRYCHGLAEDGYELMRVYPDGVAVDDAPLAQYQIDDIVDFQKEDWEADVPYSANLDPSRLLLFERVERAYDVSDGAQAAELKSPDRHDDALFDVRLLPGELFSLGAKHVAQSWDDATCVALLDNIYLPAGVIPGEAADYRFYRALSCFVAYDKRDPGTAVVMKGDFVDPPCADTAWLESPENADAALAVENRLPEFDPTELYADLATSLLLLLLM